MKNQNILPNTEVPFELRQEVYKNALEAITKIADNDRSFGLCIMLPRILWGVKHDCHPNGEHFYFADSDVLFPELKAFLQRDGFYGEYSNNDRVEFLKSVIK